MGELTSLFNGVTIIAKEGMMRGGWFLKDAEDRVLSSGVVGMGKLDTPGADLTQGVRIECHPSLYDAFTARRQALRLTTSSTGGDDA